MRGALKLLAGLALSAFTLWLFLRGLDFRKVAASLAQASVPLLLVSIVVGYFGHLGMRARRWGTMLQPLRADVPFYDRFSTTAIGYAVSWLAPGRMGEVVRPILLARREKIPVAGVLAIAVMERLLDVVAVVVLAAGAALTAPLWWTEPAGSVPVSLPGLGETDLVGALAMLGIAGLLGCVAGLLVLRWLVMEGSWFLRHVDRRRAGTARLAKLWGIVRHVAEGAAFIRSPRRALVVGLESIVLWTVVSFGTWIGLHAARVSIPFPGTFLLVALSALGIAVPTPGGAGPVHVAFQRGLIDLFGVEANLATAATVLYHPVIIYVPPILFGLGFAWRDGFSAGKLKALAKSEAKDGAAP